MFQAPRINTPYQNAQETVDALVGEVRSGRIVSEASSNAGSRLPHIRRQRHIQGFNLTGNPVADHQ